MFCSARHHGRASIVHIQTSLPVQKACHDSSCLCKLPVVLSSHIIKCCEYLVNRTLKEIAIPFLAAVKEVASVRPNLSTCYSRHCALPESSPRLTYRTPGRKRSSYCTQIFQPASVRSPIRWYDNTTDITNCCLRPLYQSIAFGSYSVASR